MVDSTPLRENESGDKPPARRHVAASIRRRTSPSREYMTGMDVFGFQVGDALSSYLQTCVASSIGPGSSSASVPERPHQLISECSVHALAATGCRASRNVLPSCVERRQARERRILLPASAWCLPNSCKLQLWGRINGCRHEAKRRH